jgi:hypothetical protein
MKIDKKKLRVVQITLLIFVMTTAAFAQIKLVPHKIRLKTGETLI